MATTMSITIRAGDTEPLPLTIDAVGLTNLDALDTAVLYARKVNAASNHVDGGALAVLVSADKSLTFNPVGQKSGGGNAFDAPGVYRAYVLATWNDGDETRHPGDGSLTITVAENYE